MFDIINEGESKREYGCVMLFFDYPQMYKIQDAINPKHYYEELDDDSYGPEGEPHVTLLYGLHPEVTTEQVTEAINDITFSRCELHNPSCFNNEKYDVFKFDVKGSSLHKANERLKKFPFTSDFPDYHPHMTIAYLTPGMGERYVRMLDKGKDDDHYIKPKYAVYSKTDGTKEKLKIKVY